MENNHKFYKSGDSWFVRCITTGGEFSTQLWKSRKLQNRKCPCCGVIIQ